MTLRSSGRSCPEVDVRPLSGEPLTPEDLARRPVRSRTPREVGLVGAGPASRPISAGFPALLVSSGCPSSTTPMCLPLGPDDTEYRRLDLPPGRVVEAAGRTFLEIAPATITALVREAVHDIQHLLRPSHLAQLRAIVDDPEASANDRFVATDLLRNACVSAGGVLPMCQDTGTAIVVGKRTETVLTGGDDEARRLAGHLRGLRRAEPALLADGADVVLGRAEHRHEPARAGRAVHRAGRRRRSTSSWCWPRAAARPTRRSSTRRRRRC